MHAVSNVISKNTFVPHENLVVSLTIVYIDLLDPVTSNK